MMKGSGGVLAVIVAALLVCCSADPHQEQDSSDHGTGNRFDGNDIVQTQELEDFMRFLIDYENRIQDRSLHYGRNLNGIGGSLVGRNLNGIGGSSLLGRNLGGLGGSSLLGRNLDGLGGSSLLGRNLDGLGGSSLLGRNLNGIGGSSLLGRNINGIGGTTLVGRDAEQGYPKRFIDSLGGGNFVRNLDSIGGGNFVRNLDSIGGGNLVKKNLDALGGPNLVKRTLDSLGGGNLVRRQLDSIGDHKTRNLDPLGGGNLVRQVRESRPSWVPFMGARRIESPYGGKRDLWPLVSPMEYGGYYAVGLPKRNFDEIDRSGLDNFVRKRNFDEIDQTSMPFPYASKRFVHLYAPNYLGASDYDKKRSRGDIPLDELDVSAFPIGSKSSSDNYPMLNRNMR